MELREGRWQDVLSDIESCDACITDPPYGERTHKGQHTSGVFDNSQRRDLSYAFWTEQDVTDFCDRWSAAGWIAALSDSNLFPTWNHRLGVGRTVFPPIPCVLKGMTVRLAGDGPSSWAIYLNASRTRQLSKWGTLPGAYVGAPARGGHIGGKPLWLMQQIVSDYSRPGDLIVDPCAGGGTTLLAAAIEGRRAIGAEMDPNTFELAVKRLSKGYTPRLIPDALPKPKQGELI